jgi:signal transduction histidine kinase
LDRYVLAVSAAGSVLLAFSVMQLDLAGPASDPLPFAIFVTFVLIGEFIPIRVPYRNDVLDLTISTTFAFGLMLMSGTPAAVLALAIGSAAADIAQRKPAPKIIFNVAQYTLSLAAAGAVYAWLSHGDALVAALWPALLAGVVFFLLNYGLVAVATGLAQGTGVWRAVQGNFVLALWSSGMLLAIAPAAVLVAQVRPELALTLVLPVAAVWLAAKGAASAHELAGEQSRLASAEQALVRELQEADRIKSALLAKVSHELRSPLTTILGALRTIAANDERLAPEDRRDLLEMSSRQGERLRQLIEQLLVAAHPDDPVLGQSGIVLVDRGVVDLAELTRTAVRGTARRFGGRTIELRATGPLRVRAEPAAVTQILTSLLDNACKFSPDDQPVQVTAEASGQLAVIAVQDAGPGVAARDQQRIFERFALANERGGVGLGLYVARQLARGQGGEVLIATDTGGSASQGARFELRLPLTDEAGNGRSARAS